MSRKAAYIALSVMCCCGGVWSCAEEREPRSELFNENIYLGKHFLTRPNPHHTNAETGEKDDYGWLLGVSVTATSVPTAIPDIFPGLQGELKYVRFMFSQDTLQLVSNIAPGPYGDEASWGSPGEAADLAPRVLQEYGGAHVDLQLRRDLDGEVTNFTEENRERDWELRQHFKFKPEEGRLSDLARLSWYYDWSVSPAMKLVSTSLVPGSFKYVDTVDEVSNMDGVVDWEKGDYIEWKVRLTYQVDTRYESLMNFRAEIDTQTVDIKYSFWRRPDVAEDAYVVRPVDEKDPYRRKFGIWDYVIQHYQDPQTGFIGAKVLMSRYNPDLPIDFYMVDVPEEFLNHPERGDLYESVAGYANTVFEQAGVKARVAFHAKDEGGVQREFGDIRYNFVYWHNNAFTDIPWLGYGPSWIDPRTGEIVSATLNMNNWQGLHWYTYVVKDLLEQTSDAFDEGAGSCAPGELRPIVTTKVTEQLQSTTLFSKMVSSMGEQPEEWVMEHDEDWYDRYHALLPELRFFYPPYQTFVYSGPEGSVQEMRPMREEMMARERDFREINSKLDSIESPTGYNDFTAPGAIEAGLEFIHKTKEAMSGHMAYMNDRRMVAGLRGMDLVDGPTLLGSIANINQKCKPDGTWQTFDEWEDDIRWRIAHQTSVHELGHNIGLYHNFYGSLDRKHYQTCSDCVGEAKGSSSSVMDYVHHFAEVGADLGFYPYDKAALIYAYRYDSQEAVEQETDQALIRILHPEWHDPAIDPAGETPGPQGDKHPERSLLFANDYHLALSPLVSAFDLGSTPTEIVYNAIQYYDWMYRFRNFRSYRQYWETWNYPYTAFDSTFPLRRFLDLWALDWNGQDLENDLRLLGVEGDQFYFTNLREQFAAEMGQANRMVINFYQAILTQSNAERSYATTYDSYFGDVTRIGIIYDKFYAMFSFLGLWPADNYNWDLYAYLAYYETDLGNAQCYSDALNTLDAMLGGSYDVYPWFLPTAVLVFAEDTHNISFGDQAKKEWIGFRTFDRAQDMIDYFGFDPRDQCMGSAGVIDGCTTAALGSENDGHQAFHDRDGGQWSYLFLDDRNMHVCASADLSPISFKMIWDHNESININHADYVDTYDIKYFIDYYTYFN